MHSNSRNRLWQAQGPAAEFSTPRNHASNRRFFWKVLIASATVSVGGNILHALIIGPIPPVLAALIATVAPLSLLATTHGLATLTRFNPEREIR